jgi:hypothetical protein
VPVPNFVAKILLPVPEFPEFLASQFPGDVLIVVRIFCKRSKSERRCKMSPIRGCSRRKFSRECGDYREIQVEFFTNVREIH